MKTINIAKLKIAGLTLMTTLTLSGCGGGGNSGSGNKTLAGTLLGLARAPLVGYRVVYDSGTPGTQMTTTDINGQYKFVLPPTTITGSDSLTFYDAAGHLAVQQALPPLTSLPNFDITTVAPPIPPAGV